MQSLKKIKRPKWEFERDRPIYRKQGGHIPDLSLSVKQREISPIGSASQQRNSIRTHSRKITLDTLFIVEILGTSHFNQVKEIDASSQRLNSVDVAALRELVAVQKADFSDNSLPLEPFAVMPALEELDFSCNSLRKFDYKDSEAQTGDDKAWGKLVSLNLSFNALGSYVSELQWIPQLTKLNLSFNSLNCLPSNLNRFTCLSYLDLTGNNVNSDADFYSLATIPFLQTLILNDNNVIRIPKFSCGFEALVHISLRGNKLGSEDEICTLLDLEQLKDVDIIGNPILLLKDALKAAKVEFARANVELKCDLPVKQTKHTLAGPLRKVKFDPLVLPSFAPAHIRALNRRQTKSTPNKDLETMNASDNQQEVQHAENSEDVFMTSFAAQSGEDEGRVEIEPTMLPEPEEPIATSVWSEVPVVQVERRIALTQKRRPEFLRAFRKLEYVVSHPDLRIKPKESAIADQDETEASEEQVPDTFKGREQSESKQPRGVAMQLAARTQYTKDEIENMLQSMEERLAVVEKDLQITDETGQNAVDIALDQKNFANLHKQYETIRAELINTLNA